MALLQDLDWEELLISPNLGHTLAGTMAAKPSLSRRRLVAGVAAQQPRLLDRIVAKAQSEIVGYGTLDPALLRPLTATMVSSMLSALVEHRAPSPAEVSSYREFGITRARQGVTLPEMLAAWRLAVREVLDELIRIGDMHNYSGRLQLDLTRELLDIVDVAIIEFSDGHREVELDNARRDQRARADFARAALTGTVTGRELGVLAQRYGIEPDRGLVPWRARPTADFAIDELERRLYRHATIRFTATIDGDLAGFTDHPPQSLPTPVGCGPVAPIDQLASGFAAAGRALNTAIAFGMNGVFDLAALGVLPAVLADTEIGDNLIHRYLSPLDGTDSAAIVEQTLQCYLDNGRRIDTTANQLVVHPNTIRYRLDRYKHLTGIDLGSAGTALELWWALKRQQLVRASRVDSGNRA